MFFQWFWILMGIGTFQKHPFWRQIFFSSSLYACGVFGSFDEKICISWYGLWLNWKVYEETSFFQLFWIMCWVELSRSSHFGAKICSSRLYAWEVIGSFKDEDYTIGYASRLNWYWKACNWTCFFFFKCFELCVKSENFRNSWCGAQSLSY